MRTYRFFQVDVFTDRPFGGNPLAVFPEAEGLSDREMQQLAKEMNLSETTFVLPPVDARADFKVRIFTPGTEIPFAGHPVLGTHFVLTQLGRIRLQSPVTRIHQELKVGVLPVDLYVQDGQVQRVTMTQGQPEFLDTYDDLPKLAAALNVDVDEIAATQLPVQVVSTGFPQMMIPVRSLQSVQNAGPNVAALLEIGPTMSISCFMLWTRETLSPTCTVHTRMFAPALGILEDPATGSASGGLGAYLIQHGVVQPGRPTAEMISEQGYEIDRPSTVYIEVDGEPNAITAVRVGGQVSPLIEGVVRL